MQRAFLVGILLALIIPCVGIVIVLKRLSMIGDALSHTSLAGVAAGLLFNINPVLGATAAYFAYLIPCILLYMVLATSIKKAYVRHFGELL